MIELTDDILFKTITKRPAHSHKGTFGRLLIIGGNETYGGAAILAASSAVYSGAGLVSVATAPCNHAALHARLPEAMVVDYGDRAQVKSLLASADVIVIGPGLGLNRGDLVELVMEEVREEQWVVADGSALTLIAQKQLALPFPHKTVLTPHEKELERLSGLKIGGQTVPKVQEFVEELGAVVVAKSSETKIFAPGQEVYGLTIGTPAQATGGMGDTLAGIIGSFLGQFTTENLQAITAATYLHSKIAKELAKTAYVVLPTHLIEELPRMMKKYEV